MTAPRIISAAEAAALLDAATPGPWSRLPLTVDPIGPDLIVRIRMRDGDSDLVSAAPDLAASVVALHALLDEAYDIIASQCNPAWDDWCDRLCKIDFEVMP
jgi:hypothetical protein